MRICRIGQFVLLYVLVAVGIFFLLFAAGDESQTLQPLPVGKWLAIKLGAFAVMVLCFYLGKKLNERYKLVPYFDGGEEKETECKAQSSKRVK